MVGWSGCRLLPEAGTPALRRLAGKSCASNALPANPAEFRNISRRVLCFSKNFGLIFVRLSLFGNHAEAKSAAAIALKSSNAQEVQFLATLVLAVAGDQDQTLWRADRLKSRFPEDAIVQVNYLPGIYGQLALNQGDRARAIELLQTASPFELGSRNNRGGAASAEFQKILDWPGVVSNEPVGRALALLGLARAHVLEGDRD